jgi:hypothetical protein
MYDNVKNVTITYHYDNAKNVKNVKNVTMIMYELVRIPQLLGASTIVKPVLYLVEWYC